MKSLTLLIPDEDAPRWERALELGPIAELTAHLSRVGTLAEFIDWRERAQEVQRDRELRQANAGPARPDVESEPPPGGCIALDISSIQGGDLQVLKRIKNIRRIDGAHRIWHNRKDRAGGFDQLGMLFDVMAALGSSAAQREDQRRQAMSAEEKRRQQEAWAERERENAPLIQD